MSVAASVAHDPAHGKVDPLVSRLGMWVFLFSDAMMFAAIFATYAMLRSLDPAWPDPKTRLNLPLTGVFTFVLICSSVTMVYALERARSRDRSASRLFLGLTILGGAGFLSFQAYEWGHFLHQGLTARTDVFFATFYALTGFHGFHVASGLGVLLYLLARTGPSVDDAKLERIVECGALYWHFVDLVWIVLFTVVYLL